MNLFTIGDHAHFARALAHFKILYQSEDQKEVVAFISLADKINELKYPLIHDIHGFTLMDRAMALESRLGNTPGVALVTGAWILWSNIDIKTWTC